MSTSGEQAVRSLLNHYGFYIDTARFEAFAGLFAEDGVWGFEGAQYHGRQEILEFSKTVIVYPDGTTRTKHTSSNEEIVVDEDAGTARAESYVTVYQQTDALPIQPIFSGHYFDECVRIDGRWYFQSRTIRHGLMGDLSHHIRS